MLGWDILNMELLSLPCIINYKHVFGTWSERSVAGTYKNFLNISNFTALDSASILLQNFCQYILTLILDN